MDGDYQVARGSHYCTELGGRCKMFHHWSKWRSIPREARGCEQLPFLVLCLLEGIIPLVVGQLSSKGLQWRRKSDLIETRKTPVRVSDWLSKSLDDILSDPVHTKSRAWRVPIVSPGA